MRHQLVDLRVVIRRLILPVAVRVHQIARSLIRILEIMGTLSYFKMQMWYCRRSRTTHYSEILALRNEAADQFGRHGIRFHMSVQRTRAVMMSYDDTVKLGRIVDNRTTAVRISVGVIDDHPRGCGDYRYFIAIHLVP